MTVKEAIFSRKSIRKYLNKEVPPELLQQVLEAGQQAPSGRNGQEWKFVVSTERKKGLLEACMGQSCVEDAPVFLVVCSEIDKIMPNQQNQGSMNCAIALSFMMLQAEELGLSTVWLGYFDVEKLKKVLDIPENLIPVGATPLGYSAESGRPRTRKSLDEIVLYR